MLVSHVVPPQMRWQSRLFNDFDYLDCEPDAYFEDADRLNRLIVVAPGIKHKLKNNVFSIIKNADFLKTLTECSGQHKSKKHNTIAVLTGDPDESWQQLLKSPVKDLGIEPGAFTDYKRGNNAAEQMMYARFSFISKYKRSIIDNGIRIWLLGFTYPHEVRRYGREVYACIDDVVVREAFWRNMLTQQHYDALHEGYPDDPVVPLGAFESIRLFNDWVHN